MKKTFAILAVAMMMFATGCGKNTPTADEVKQDANAVVDQAKEKVDEAKETATNAANNAVETAQAMIDDAKKTMDDLKSGAAEKTVFALDGVVPGINVDTVKEILGEPIDSNGENLAFSNGLDMKVVDNIVQEVSTKYDGLPTPANVAVGMAESVLNSAYGNAVSVTNGDDGSAIYKYVSKDNRRTLEITTRDGSVSEIKCSLNK